MTTATGARLPDVKLWQAGFQARPIELEPIVMRRSPFVPTDPTVATLAGNDKVRKALAAHGDNGTTARHVMHFLLRDNNSTISEIEMAEELRGLGFYVDPAKCANGIIAEEHREIASIDFDGLTQSLSDLASRNGWVYDGFECAIEVMN